MKSITFDYSKNPQMISQEELLAMEASVKEFHSLLHSDPEKGPEGIGWVQLPMKENPQELQQIKRIAQEIQEHCDILVVIGIGGSYLGAKAAIDMLTPYFKVKGEGAKPVEVYFAGHQLSTAYLKELLAALEGKEVALNVISKSGTTLEPAIAFRILKDYMENRYGKEGARKRIIVTTDPQKGALREMAMKEGYETLVIPRTIGGRYSVLTPVGLLPMAVAGIDIDQVLEGAKQAYLDCSSPEVEQNPCYQYAVIRNLFYQKNKQVELFVSYEPCLVSFGEWWKQLFGESEGKEHKGLFPAAVSFTTDLHSMGQYIQEGSPILFETILSFQQAGSPIFIEADPENLDGLNYLAGKTLEDVNQKAMEGTCQAHLDGGVPQLLIQVPERTPYYFGYLVYWFEKACGMSAYLLGVNPFDQPGVEAYKKNMFRLLGKPQTGENK